MRDAGISLDDDAYNMDDSDCDLGFYGGNCLQECPTRCNNACEKYSGLYSCEYKFPMFNWHRIILIISSEAKGSKWLLF